MHSVEIDGALCKLAVGDITKQDVDAIVNAANKRLSPGGGVSGAIHRAAGPGLWDECKKIGGCRTGEAKITKGQDLLAKYVIHTVGPVYSGKESDAVFLSSCYRSCFRLADKYNISSIAFPAISTGIFGYPLDEAAMISLREVLNFLKNPSSIKLVRFVLFSNDTFQAYEKAFYVIFKDKT
jgi:O-acetyl-ADP-ribose deacetylase (regulator of RNase III)